MHYKNADFCIRAFKARAPLSLLSGGPDSVIIPSPSPDSLKGQDEDRSKEVEMNAEGVWRG